MPTCIDCGATFGTQRSRSPRCEACRKRHRAAQKDAYAKSDAGRAAVAKGQRKYAASNRDKVNAKSKKYRDKNRDTLNAKERERYWENRDEEIVKSREKYTRHADKRRAESRAYYHANSEQCRARSMEYYRANREKYRQYFRDYRAKRRALVKAVQSPELWMQAKAVELQYCDRIKVRMLHLPCGMREECFLLPKCPKCLAENPPKREPFSIAV